MLRQAARCLLVLCAFLPCIASPCFAEVVFADDFSGNAGDPPDAQKWNVTATGGSVALDGDGHLVLTGVDAWNVTGIESRFTIPGNGEATYEIEFHVLVPQHAPHYIGLSATAGAVGPTNHRAFALQGTSAAFANSKGLNLTTSNSGHATGALSSDAGIATDVTQYPINQPLVLRMRLETSRSLVWEYNDGNGYRPIRVTGGDARDQWILSTWTKGPGCQFPITIQANGWQAADKRLVLDRVFVSKLPAGKGLGYIENPNLVLEFGETPGDQQVATRRIAPLRSRESPTGSGIWYVRDDIEEVNYPPFQGEYYESMIPDTLDLAERGRLAVHGITNIADPRTDYQCYGWIGNPKSGKVIMRHSYHAYNGGQHKWMRELPHARTMSGSEFNSHVDKKMMETMFRMLGEDGLYYIPVKGQPWIGAKDSQSPWTEPGVEQVFDVGPNGRTLLCLVSWYARDPADEVLQNRIERMIDGFLRIAIRKDDFLYLPRHFYDGNVPLDEPVSTGGTAVTSQSTVLAGLARYYRMTKYPPAREFGDGFARYWLGPAKILRENGDWDWSGPGTHFHGTTMALNGLLEWGLATDDDPLLETIRKAYEFGRQAGNRYLGWFPEGIPASHANCEPCGIGDMVMLACKLSYHGVGDYWEDVERYTRNLLAEAQVVDGWFAQRVADEQPGSEPIDEPYETADLVTQKMIGTFSGMIAVNGFFQPVSSHCCTGNGNRGLFHAWRHIVTHRDGELRVNLLLNRASQWADVNSHLPFDGRVDIHPKKQLRLLVRIPLWVEDPSSVTCTVDALPRECGWDGRYLDIGSVQAGEEIQIAFPMTDETVKTEIQGAPYTLRIRGFNVVDIYPKNKLYPFFDNETYRQDRTVWKKAVRFAPDDEEYW